MSGLAREGRHRLNEQVLARTPAGCPGLCRRLSHRGPREHRPAPSACRLAALRQRDDDPDGRAGTRRRRSPCRTGGSCWNSAATTSKARGASCSTTPTCASTTSVDRPACEVCRHASGTRGTRTGERGPKQVAESMDPVFRRLSLVAREPRCPTSAARIKRHSL